MAPSIAALITIPAFLAFSNLMLRNTSVYINSESFQWLLMGNAPSAACKTATLKYKAGEVYLIDEVRFSV